MSIQISNPYSIRLGVLGAGTMGSGIALTALLSNMLVMLYDVSPQMLEQARSYIDKHLARKGQASGLKNLVLTQSLEDLTGAGVVVEAVPEDLALKQKLFARLDLICSPPAILATNTSTLPVTAIAAATSTPERVAGMHFFNPAPVLPLVEVIRGAQTNPDTIQTLVKLAQLIGKTPVVARDTPGFIVNRVARPFYGEALRLLGEGTATHSEIDLVVRLGGGFRMGPFQLMDLIGIDVNFAAMQSMYEQTFGEPRYRPHLIQAQMVQQKALGRKSGRGFYRYDPDHPTADPDLPRQSKHSGQVMISRGYWGPGTAETCRKAGYTFTNDAANHPIIGIVIAGKSDGLKKQVLEMDRSLPADVPLLCQCADITLTELAAWVSHPERLVGFDGLFFASGSIASLVSSPTLTPQARAAVESFVTSTGRLQAWIQDSPALILPRIVSMLANEAAFALGEGVAELKTIDKAMQLGVNYPKGPLTWAKEIGYPTIVETLDHLHAEYGEERYRVAPLLRRWARLSNVTD